MSKIKIGNIKGPKGDKGETGAVGPKGEQGIQGPVGPAGGVNSVNGMTGDVTVEDTQGVNLLTGTSKITVSSFGDTQVARTNDGVKCIYSINARGGIVVPISKIDNTSRQIYTVSFLYKSTLENKTPWFYFMQKENQFTISNVPIEISNDWKKYTAVLDFSSVNVDNPTSLLLCYLSADLEGQYIEIKDGTLKLEPGTVTNPVWTPAPEDIATHTDVEQAVTGENLLIDSDVEQNSTSELIASWDMASPDVINQEYTFTVCITPSSGMTDILLHRNSLKGLIDDAIPLKGTGKQIISHTFVNTESSISRLIHPGIGRLPREDTGKAIAHWAKLEKGINPNPFYTPAPRDQLFHALDPIAEMHRNLYRGRNLGESTAMSAAHKAAIQNGSFRDLFVGDYWTHEGINYRIADIDYFYNCGNTNFTTHHLVIVPDKCLGTNKQMNSTDSTENGYKGSDMRENVLPTIKAGFIDKAFPDLVLSHREYLTTEIADGYPSKGEWVDSDVELMNEIMVYGCPVFTPANTGATVPALYTIDNSQLALFQLNPRMIKTRYNYWLRDVVSASSFALVASTGVANATGASNTSIGVRPVFCIGVVPTGDEASDDMEVVSPMQEGDYMEEELE